MLRSQIKSNQREYQKLATNQNSKLIVVTIERSEIYCKSIYAKNFKEKCLNI